jgi:hypothetical protein
MTMKEVTMTTTIPAEFKDAEESEWAVYLIELRGNYYDESLLATEISGVHTQILVGGC